MPQPSSAERPVPPGSPQDVRLDDTDRTLVTALLADARLSNKDLAGLVGIAPSTCLARVRALRTRGVIRGFHADIDPRALGHDLQAMIAIRLQPDARRAIVEYTARLTRYPEVLEVYFVAGANDFLVHVATASTDELRRFVGEQLNRDPAVAGTETNLIFEHTRGRRV
ncbi:Lrp/AsnC family transcriptional regulator [Pseudonocardia hydrocarbonoxydans]|uniref:AsnC family transcriptional regulator n=1 Tax=Pseudonocardia hydrocarbonoxydans TaxID=76726 RepID=A0A4Y3WZH4_9PSEU|nr:Lrp/AsnC family transcriptional regulator [Pseudonocardia hydrocarbonoxydans]GEC22846.1 AsnC family transcriptional regulator [Pseudonocardia hydrocarbonoxydans]